MRAAPPAAVSSPASDNADYRFSDKSLPKKTVAFGSADTLKLVLTANEGGEAKRPHQAFLVFQEPETGLEAPFVMATKENGKATVDLVCTAAADSAASYTALHGPC